MSGRELVERLFEAESRGDVDEIVAVMAEDVVLNLTCRLLYARDAETLFRGKEAVRRVYEVDVQARGPSFRITAEQIVEQGNTVAAVWVAKRGTAGEIVRRGVDVFEVRDALISCGTVYLDLTTVPELSAPPKTIR